MKISLPIILLLLVSTIGLQAQQLSIDEQFEDLIKKSNNYQEYKVVEKVKINRLRKNVSDSVKALEQEIVTINSEKELQNTSINQLTNELEATKKELTISKGKEEGINVLGILTKKSTYTLVVFVTLGILLLVIIILFIRYKSGFDIIKATKAKLDETDEEFENFRQRSLEREQQIRRKLQDEINKNKA